MTSFWDDLKLHFVNMMSFEHELATQSQSKRLFVAILAYIWIMCDYNSLGR